MKQKLIALVTRNRGGQKFVAGEPFEASGPWARIYKNMGWAKAAGEETPQRSTADLNPAPAKEPVVTKIEEGTPPPASPPLPQTLPVKEPAAAKAPEEPAKPAAKPKAKAAPRKRKDLTAEDGKPGSQANRYKHRALKAED